MEIRFEETLLTCYCVSIWLHQVVLWVWEGLCPLVFIRLSFSSKLQTRSFLKEGSDRWSEWTIVSPREVKCSIFCHADRPIFLKATDDYHCKIVVSYFLHFVVAGRCKKFALVNPVCFDPVFTIAKNQTFKKVVKLTWEKKYLIEFELCIFFTFAKSDLTLVCIGNSSWQFCQLAIVNIGVLPHCL